jgi:hypothetical protein
MHIETEAEVLVECTMQYMSVVWSIHVSATANNASAHDPIDELRAKSYDGNSLVVTKALPL